MKNLFLLISNFAVVSLLISLSSDAVANHEDPNKITQRTAPVGKVYRTGDTIKQPEVAVTLVETASEPRSAEKIYSTCAGCHDTGAAGAPIVGNKDHWAPRINKGFEALLANAINGVGNMPAKGLCMDCSDDEIKATVEFMVGKSQ